MKRKKKGEQKRKDCLVIRFSCFSFLSKGREKKEHSMIISRFSSISWSE
jgi:hypothetical protein